jgi:hypothetical protein
MQKPPYKYLKNNSMATQKEDQKKKPQIPVFAPSLQEHGVPCPSHRCFARNPVVFARTNDGRFDPTMAVLTQRWPFFRTRHAVSLRVAVLTERWPF